MTRLEIKEIITSILMENTYYENIYTGGGIEPRVIVLSGSDDQDQEEFINSISDKIIKEIL